MVFWQSPRTRKQARPDVRLPAARAAGIAELEILVDSRERYAYRFAGKPVRAISRALSCGDYAVTAGAKLVAAVERKSLPDLVSSLSNGRLRFALGELAALPRAAVVVEERYSRVFAQTGSARRRSPTGWPSCRSAGRPSRSCSVRPARWPRNGPYRYLAAAHEWATTEDAAVTRIALTSGDSVGTADAPAAPDPTTAEVRAWARAHDIEVSNGGRLRPEIWQAWREAHRR
jgi:hypothetical protein